MAEKAAHATVVNATYSKDGQKQTTSPWESWGASDDGHTRLFRMIEKKPSSLGDMRAMSVEWHSGRSLSQRDKGPF